MNGTLLDTNVVSELMRKSPHPVVIRWLDSSDISQFWIAAFTITELERGILLLNDLERATQLRTRVNKLIEQLFEDRVIVFDRRAAIQTARYQFDSTFHPNHHLADSIIAGSAISHGLRVATRNEKDFNDELIEIVNPWKFASYSS